MKKRNILMIISIAVIGTLGDEANKYLPMVIGDLQTYITERIEASVKESKQ